MGTSGAGDRRSVRRLRRGPTHADEISADLDAVTSPRRGPHPARAAAPRAGDAAHELVPGRRRGRQPAAVPRAEARPERGSRPPAARVPMFEIFVYSPRVEGVHLRAGQVARGGIRWSDRREDFRTEVLGLMKAQRVKNAVIVPAGAKGGFVVKRPPADAGRAARRGRGLLPAVHRRAPRRHRQPRRRQGRATRPGGAVRRRRPVPRRRRRQGHRRVLRRRERDRAATAASGSATRSRRAASTATTTRRWASPPAARGSRCGGTSATSISIPTATTSPSPASATCRATSSATPCCSPSTSASSPRSTTGTCSSIPTPDPARSFVERRRLFELPRSSWADYDPRCSPPAAACTRAR